MVVSGELARNRLTAAMAHELQHAREVAEATNVRSSADMQALFKRLDSGTCVLIRSCMETVAAVRLEAVVLDELTDGRSRELTLPALQLIRQPRFRELPIPHDGLR